MIPHQGANTVYYRSAKVLLSLALVLVVCVAVSGCGSKVSKANFDKIKDGMTEKEVEDVLGKPTQTGDTGAAAAAISSKIPGADKIKMPNMKVAQWKDGNKAISITFVDGKVAQKLGVGL
jgi:hypothetical protein